MKLPLKSALIAAGIVLVVAQPASAFVFPPVVGGNDSRAPLNAQYVYRETPAPPWLRPRPLPPLPPLDEYDDRWDGAYDDYDYEAPPRSTRPGAWRQYEDYPDRYDEDVLTPEEYYRRYGRQPDYQDDPARYGDVDRGPYEPRADTVVRGPHRQPKKNPKRIARAGGEPPMAPSPAETIIREDTEPPSATDTTEPTENTEPSGKPKPSDSAKPAIEPKPADDATQSLEAKTEVEEKPEIEVKPKTGIRVIVPPRPTNTPSVIIPSTSATKADNSDAEAETPASGEKESAQQASNPGEDAEAAE